MAPMKLFLLLLLLLLLLPLLLVLFCIHRANGGECILAVSEPLLGFPSPEMAEAMALRRAVLVALDRGFDRVTFASDCLSLVQRISAPSPDRSMVGVVVLENKSLMARFASAYFKHVRRFFNEH